MQTSDAEFELWLQALPGLGYPRTWIRNNITALEKRFRETKGAEMKPCPEPATERYDPYRGL